LKYFKSIILIVFFTLFSFHKHKAQCLFLVPSGSFNCATGQGIVNYIINGGTPGYTITAINSLGVAVVSGTTATNTGTLNNLPMGIYTITAVDNGSCTTSTSYIVTVPFSASNVVFTTSLSCFGSNTGIANASIAGGALTPPFTYTWSNGSNSQTAFNLSAGVYSVTVQDSQGCTVTNSVTVGQNTQISSTFNSTLVPCFGGTLSTGISSSGGISPYTYSVNGVAISSSTASGLSVGIKTITTKDLNGCLQTNTVALGQVSPPVITFTVTKPSCVGYTNGAVSASVSNAPPAFNYTWQPSVSFTNSIQNIASGNYTLTVKDASACVTKSVVNVSPAVSMTLSALTHSENCSAADGGATVSVVGGNFPYSFSTVSLSTTSNILTNLTSGTYTTIVTDANNCKDSLKYVVGNLSTVVVSISSFTPVLCYGNCDGKVQLSTLNAILPITYSASGTPTTSSSLITNLCAGLVNIKVIDAIGCPATTTINFAQPPVFSYSATQPAISCFGKPITLQANASGGVGAYNFVWNPGGITGQVISLTPTASTVYSLNVYDANGCTLAPFQVTATINPPINITINNTNTGICPGTTAQITPTLSGGDGNYSYTWLPGSTTNPSIFVENITIPTYTLIVNDGCGSPTATKIITINLFPKIVPTYVTLQDTGCQPFCTQFINTTPKSTLAIWNYGDKPYEQIGNTTSYCYYTSGIFNLKLAVTDSNQCKTSFTYTNAINVLASPIANFTTVPAQLTLNNCDNFTLKNTTQNGISYKWFAEGLPYGQNVDINNYALHDTGCYNFKLIAINQNNCIDTSEKYICVIEGYNFYIPDSFTPNDDNLNEIFKPIGTGWTTTNYLFEIFNRWGTRIFSTTDMAKGWDGKATNDNYDPSNVYFWRVKIKDNQDNDHLHSGHVSLLR
jgi:gliding motility-associated-like protein